MYEHTEFVNTCSISYVKCVLFVPKYINTDYVFNINCFIEIQKMYKIILRHILVVLSKPLSLDDW